MSDRNTPETKVEEEVLFRRSVRGYNMMEVDEYISGIRSDIDNLRSECARLSEELEAANAELEDFRKKEEDAEAVYLRAESEAKKILEDAESEAEKILSEAKSRAAHTIMRTSSQCNKISAAMARQVVEQRRLYSAAKAEVFSFREKLFEMYKEHIGKINTFAEAAGASDRDALTAEEINAFFELMGDGGFDSSVSDEARSEVDRLRESRKKKAVSGAAAKKPAPAPETVAAKKPEPTAESGAAKKPVPPVGSGAAAERAAERAPKAGAAKVSEPTAAGNRAETSSDVRRPPEAKAPAAKKKAPVEEETWFDAVDDDADEFEEAAVSSEPAAEDDSEEFYSPAKEVDEYYLSEEDADEFYSEDDDEFYPSSGGSVLTGTVASFGFDTPSDEARARESKWKVRKSMSLTDEFDAVANEDDDE